MFTNRRNSQKPGEELYAAFKQSFPEVGPGTSSAEPGPASTTQRSTSLANALIDPTSHRYALLPSCPHQSFGFPSHSFALSHTRLQTSAMMPLYHTIDHEGEDDEHTTDYFVRHYGDLDEIKEQDATPKGLHETWRLTPSLMDPNFNFASFAQPSGYYTPTPGGINTLYHSAAGDLHTPGMGMNTPLSMPHSLHSLQAQDQSINFNHFQPQTFHHQTFQDPYGQHQQQHPPPQHLHPQSFAPSQFLHQDSGYGQPLDSGSLKTTPIGMGMAPPAGTQTATREQQEMPPGMRIGEKSVPLFMNSYMTTDSRSRFRFHTQLNAPTAMIRHADEIPITYLNKGQAYNLAIFDTAPLPQTAAPIKYRTYVRVSFEDGEQRMRPGACWQLWKEGRGTNEAHQRGGRLQAVEFVDPNQGGDETTRKSQVELVSQSFDGFCVNWTLNPSSGTPDCAISVRFNFLSTDFSHSKGVKGIPVRLCSKTEMIQPPDMPSHSGEAEVCFAKVKLFRDHGAERKLSNDVQHIKKTMDKIQQQIHQAEQGLVSAGKRKRSNSNAKGAQKPGKVLKHRRTWSMDSEGEREGVKMSAEEDLAVKLVELQDMFSSGRPASILYLKGEPEDDPDLFPVQLSLDTQEMTPITRQGTWESRPSITSALSSPSASRDLSPTDSASTTTPKRKFSEVQQSTIPEDEAEHMPEEAVKVPKIQRDSAPRSPMIALDVDTNYQPPSARPIKPVACFYVRSKLSDREYYRAVYLMQRTVRDLVNGISNKFEVDPSRVTRVTHVNARGLRIIVDEDVVRELPEGQDMIVEFAQSTTDQPMKQDFIAPAATEVITDSDFASFTATTDPLEMWLNY
jgi:CP2 transcription factor